MTCHQRHHSEASAPRLRRDCALFFDVDGTLPDIAISLDAAIVLHRRLMTIAPFAGRPPVDRSLQES